MGGEVLVFPHKILEMGLSLDFVKKNTVKKCSSADPNILNSYDM